MVSLSIFRTWPIIPIALALDLLIGDPVWHYHPIRIIGRLATWLEPRFRRLTRNMRLNGALFNLLIVVGIAVLTYLVAKAFYALNFLTGIFFEIIIVYFCLALRSLTDEGRIASRYLKANNFEMARNRVQTIVSRSLEHEDERGVIRALLESLMENLSDGVIAPLFFAMLGGAPLVLAYKAINTLDSMVGYKNEKYRDFGWFSARLDDVANFIPARLTGVLLVMSSAIFGQHPIKAIRAWKRDAQLGPSPNGGIPIAVFAGARDISLGGDCYDKEGNVIPLPQVGGQRKELTLQDINWALIYIFFISLVFALLLLVPLLKF